MTNTRAHSRHVGELLTEEGVITSEQLDEALRMQSKSGGLLGLILMDMGLINEVVPAELLAAAPPEPLKGDAVRIDENSFYWVEADGR